MDIENKLEKGTMLFTENTDCPPGKGCDILPSSEDSWERLHQLY